MGKTRKRGKGATAPGKAERSRERAARAVAEAGRLDRDLTHRAARHRDTWPVRAAAVASDIADQPPLIALSGLTAAIGLATGRADLLRGGLRMLAAHTLATGIKNAIKDRVVRTRPDHAIKEGHRFGPGADRDHELTSFPSGHLAGAVAVARAAAHEIDGTAMPATLATLGVAAILPPAGKHYPSDMLAGAAIGWAAERLVGWAFAQPVLDRLLPDAPAFPGRSAG